MPNRIIKDSICTSESLAAVDWFTEVLFYRLIVNADDFGLMDARLAILKGKLFPLDDVSREDIKRGLDCLTQNRIIKQCDVDGRPYLQIVTWSKHQRIRNIKPKYPQPPGTKPAVPKIKAKHDEEIFKEAEGDSCDIRGPSGL